MQIQDQPHIGVLGADPAAITQFLRRVQALDGEHAVLLPLSPAAVPDCEPYLCGASTQPPLPKLRAAAEVLAASGCTVIAVPDSAGIFCEQLTAAVGIPVLGTAGAALPQLVGKLRQRASVLCTPGVRAANVYGLAARRYGLHCGYPDAPVQALLSCVQPEKACSEQVLRSIIELELARGNDCVVLDSAQLCAAFAHFGLAARYPQAPTAWSCWHRPRCCRVLRQPASAAHKTGKRLRAPNGARSRCLSDRKYLLRIDVPVVIRARRVVGHVVDIGQPPAVEHQGRNGVGIGIAHGKRPIAPDDTRACDGIRPVRESQRVAQQPAVAADLIERDLSRLPCRAYVPEGGHRLRMRDRVGRVHVHGCEPCIREPRHCLRDLRIRKIDAHSRAVADRLHNGLIPLRRRDGGVGLFSAARQQRCAQQAQ